MRLRSANLDDIPNVVALESRVDTAAHWSEQQYRSAMASPNVPRTILLVEEGSRLCGFLVAGCSGDEWELENLAVSEEMRRQGVAGRLLAELLQRAVSQSIRAINLEVRESNNPARLFYEKKGFVQIGERKAYYSNPQENAVIYRLPITISP